MILDECLLIGRRHAREMTHTEKAMDSLLFGGKEGSLVILFALNKHIVVGFLSQMNVRTKGVFTLPLQNAVKLPPLPTPSVFHSSFTPGYSHQTALLMSDSFLSLK